MKSIICTYTLICLTNHVKYVKCIGIQIILQKVINYSCYKYFEYCNTY